MANELIENNPMLKKPAPALISVVKDSSDGERADIEAAAQQVWADNYHWTPAIVADMLIRNDILAEQVFVNDKLYEGTLEDLQFDKTVPVDAKVLVRLAMTDAAYAVLNDYDPSTLMRALLMEKPAYQATCR